MRPSSTPLLSVDPRSNPRNIPQNIPQNNPRNIPQNNPRNNPQNNPRNRARFRSALTLATRALALLTALAFTGPACERQSAAPSPPSSADLDPDAPAIAWQEWQRDSFARAARERKLILVTVVAGWCHWCHVMDEKTYTDPAIRTLVGRHYIAIRVDADARPDLAERYAEWGWPAIALLTPDARPVLELRGYQEASEFASQLRELAESEAAGTLKGRRSPPKKKPSAKNTSLSALRDRVKAQLDSTYDREEEGWGHRQKYPLAGPIEHALLRSRLHPEDKLWEKRALATLENELDLVDPIWGGMYQYSLYGVWTRPHYEKIAKVQVGALLSFALAYRR
ncbi:MAG TPA: thioredoxin domain-containing protein, partial [Nannocystis exedens]|nr:thioredoxin domain-containing protein [Nannocystis exedens]